MKNEEILRSHGIDPGETKRLLDGLNSQAVQNKEFSGFPSIDGQRVVAAAGLDGITLTDREFAGFLADFLPGCTPSEFKFPNRNGTLYIDRASLETLGVLLYPYTAYGILNGGSATSYGDSKKNRAYGDVIFQRCKPFFDAVKPLCEGKPKGSAPGFLHPDGTPGPSFMYLKIRSLLIESLRYRNLVNKKFPGAAVSGFKTIPLFQMTSSFTNTQLEEEILEIRKDDHIRALLDALDTDDFSVYSAAQSLVAAFTPYEPGKQVDLFMKAWGKDHTPLGLPAGHGQNFSVLKDTYRSLYRNGKRYAFLGNIDNLANVLNPLHLALTAVNRADASFEFSFKTPVDVKGGVLVDTQGGKLDCMDIGAGIDFAVIEDHIASGNQVLFNCAAGLFSLEYLNENLETIIKNLPLRISNQSKDAGSYSQIEQITWEIIGILEKPLILGVAKKDRFIAAKLLVEQILTSMAPTVLDDDDSEDLASFKELHGALRAALKNSYGFSIDGERYHMLEIGSSAW